MENILKMQGVSKNYGKNRVVDNFGITVKRGSIHGLIGPNGAGKTTIMRILAGLTAPDCGELQFFGSKENLDEYRRRMSYMIEAPIIDPSMTAYNNMKYVCLVRGVADENRINEVLDFVSLNDTGKKMAGKFSLGMKQRLGIGMALLTKPEIMVLDEPVNGLDPNGIVDIRLMLKKLAKEQNVTILISSHLLSELSEICDEFTLVKDGKVIDSFNAEELKTKCKSRIRIKTNDINATCAILEDKLSVKSYKVVHDDEIFLYEKLDEIELVSKTITDSGIIITKLLFENESLEEYYLSKVGVTHE